MRQGPRNRRWLAGVIAAGVTILSGAIGVSTAYATGTTTGVLEICKVASGAGVSGSFEFTVSGLSTKVTVPVGGCSTALTVAAGNVVVTEVARPGFAVESVSAAPADRLVSADVAAGKATVKVPLGTVANQTIVTFKNKAKPPAAGVLEICKVAAGTGVGGSFEFTVTGLATRVTVPVGGCSKALTLPAGNVVVAEVARPGFLLESVTASPADRLVSSDVPGGKVTVKIVAGTVANQTIVTFKNKVKPPARGTVKVCKKAGAGVPAGQKFTFTVGGVETTAEAGSCSLPLSVDEGNVTVVEKAAAGYQVSAITSAPAGTLVSSDLTTRTAVIKVSADKVTEVTFTNEKGKGTLKVCKKAGPGVAEGQEFSFTVDGVKTTAKAGSCSLPIELTVGDVTVKEALATGYEVTAIAVTGAGVLVSSNLATGTAVVTVKAGVTEVTFTNKKKNNPPKCTGVTASPTSLWPANHKFHTITLSGATDPDGDATTLTITGVTQDEALNGLGDGDTAPDAAWVTGRSDQVQLRAERSGTGDGRVYRIAFTVSDGKDTCTGTVYVSVPHDQSGDPAVDTTSVRVNSFG